MKHFSPKVLIIFFSFLLVACRPEPALPTLPSQVTLEFTQPTPAPEGAYTSNGGGEPRTAGYWLVWNSCMPDNQSETARANGGREAGWLLVDDLLQDPGILIAQIELTSCQEAANLLQGNGVDGNAHPDDDAYTLASQLLVAQLNLAAYAETCPAAESAVQQAQLLLLKMGFSGRGAYLPSTGQSAEGVVALDLIELLSEYNLGSLCR